MFMISTQASRWDRMHREKTQELLVANGSTIAAFGSRFLPLRIGKQQFSWSFTVAEVTQPILGADFLCAHSLMVDVAG